MKGAGCDGARHLLAATLRLSRQQRWPLGEGTGDRIALMEEGSLASSHSCRLLWLRQFFPYVALVRRQLREHIDRIDSCNLREPLE